MKYLFPALFLALLLTVPVSAQEEADIDIGKAGLTPSSPFYFLEQATETVQGWFSFDPEKKAAFNLDRANERLAELRSLCADTASTDAGDGDSAKQQNRCQKWAEKLSKRFENHFMKARQHLERYAEREGMTAQELLNLGENATDVDLPPRVQELVDKLTENNLRHQEVLQRVYEKVPDEAKESILQAMENSAQGAMNAIDSIRKNRSVETFRSQLQTKMIELPSAVRERIQTKLEQREEALQESTQPAEPIPTDPDGGTNAAQSAPTNVRSGY